ncbi:MAG: hypothetical protein ACM3OO_01770 [Planctomycetaceae bacterium]
MRTSVAIQAWRRRWAPRVLFAGVAVGLAFGVSPVLDPTVGALGKLLYPLVFAAAMGVIAWCVLNVSAFAAFAVALAAEWVGYTVAPFLVVVSRVAHLLRPMRRPW